MARYQAGQISDQVNIQSISSDLQKMSTCSSVPIVYFRKIRAWILGKESFYFLMNLNRDDPAE